MTAIETAEDTSRSNAGGPLVAARSGPPRDQLSWVWLLVGAGLLPVTGLQTLVPIAAWLAPVFLLRFTRTQRALVALPVLSVVLSGAALIGLRDGFFRLPEVSGTPSSSQVWVSVAPLRTRWIACSSDDPDLGCER